MYAVFKPVYRPLPMKPGDEKQFFSVEMNVAQQLKASGPSAALIEAKALGFIAPIVGQVKEH